MSSPELPPPTGAPALQEDGSAPPPPPGLSVPDAEGWHRLSPRMLMVHPVRSLMSMAVPLILLSLGIGRGENNRWLWFVVIGAVLAVVFGVVSWFFTRYRFTAEQLQLRTGMLSRKVVTAPLDRIRSVDIESTPVHRVLGLAKVKIGTGVDATQIELDGLTREQSSRMRSYLLDRSEVTGPEGTDAAAGERHTEGVADPATGEGEAAAARPPSGADREEELARIDWGWLRYAPFSLSSLVVVAGALGVLGQFGDDLPVDEVGVVQDSWAWVVAQSVLLLVAGALLVLVVAWVLVSTAAYVLNWWNLRVVRERGGTIRTTRGLLTTRSQTIESEKIRGVTMSEQFLLRFVKGAELSARATGVGLGGTIKLLPPAPRQVVQSVGHALLQEEGPLTQQLTGHGPRARRRIHVSEQWGSLFLAALVAVPTYWVDVWWFQTWPWWIPLAVLGAAGLLNVALAEASWRNLGHGLTEGYVIVQTGAFIRTREVLERAGVIGWVVHQSFFQRRLGLADLTATTAAGSERMVVPNVPLALAVELAESATPGMLEDFRA